jgi:hypothetical protein
MERGQFENRRRCPKSVEPRISSSRLPVMPQSLITDKAKLYVGDLVRVWLAANSSSCRCFDVRALICFSVDRSQTDPSSRKIGGIVEMDTMTPWAQLQ